MSRDLRKYASQTSFQLIVGGLLVLFVIGDGLIYLIYGQGPALMGLLCLLAGLIPVMVIILILLILDWIRKRVNHD